MSKPNGWQVPNKAAAALDERVPELRHPPSLSISPLRARRRSVVSVLTGRDHSISFDLAVWCSLVNRCFSLEREREVGMTLTGGARGWRETRIDWFPNLSCINYTPLLYFPCLVSVASVFAVSFGGLSK